MNNKNSKCFKKLHLEHKMYSDTSALNNYKISVIMPVYRAVAITAAAIDAALTSIVSNNSRMILINDNSPERDMKNMLENYQKDHSKNILLLENSRNLGFTRSINIALGHIDCEDVVLLNSDVIVPHNWLDILLRDAYSLKHIGTITPLTNNSTISSFPAKNSGTSWMLSVDVNQVNASFEQRLPLVTCPTGVGCCMYIRSECLRRVGKLNEKAFSRGYGEENDFCQRAHKRGFLNYISPNIYCHHIGGVSFLEESTKLQEVGSRKLMRLHPNYKSDVATWIARNPMLPIRIIRLLQFCKSQNIYNLLHITHNLGGGTEQHINEIVKCGEKEILHIVLKTRRRIGTPYQLGFHIPAIGQIDHFNISSTENLIYFLDFLQLKVIHIHHLAGTEGNLYKWLSTNGSRIMITFHDYYLANGNPFLTDSKGNFVGWAEMLPENTPLKDVPAPFKSECWKEESFSLIKMSSLNIFPSNDTLQRYASFFGEIDNSTVIPHDNVYKCMEEAEVDELESPDEILDIVNVVAIGAISREKGADLLESLACAAFKAGNMPLKFSVVGYTYKRLRYVTEYGPYANEALPYILGRISAEYIIFTSRCPETYSFTLSAAISQRMKIIAPRLGSFTERLEGYNDSYLYDDSASPQVILDGIMSFIKRTKESKSKAFLLANRFYYTDYIKYIREMNVSQADTQSLLSPAEIASILFQEQRANTSGFNLRVRSLILTLLYRIYSNHFLGIAFRRLPFSFIRSVKESIFPWPISHGHDHMHNNKFGLPKLKPPF